jgi:hypothetical protein
MSNRNCLYLFANTGPYFEYLKAFWPVLCILINTGLVLAAGFEPIGMLLSFHCQSEPLTQRVLNEL